MPRSVSADYPLPTIIVQIRVKNPRFLGAKNLARRPPRTSLRAGPSLSRRGDDATGAAGPAAHPMGTCQSER